MAPLRRTHGRPPGMSSRCQPSATPSLRSVECSGARQNYRCPGQAKRPSKFPLLCCSAWSTPSATPPDATHFGPFGEMLNRSAQIMAGGKSSSDSTSGIKAQIYSKLEQRLQESPPSRSPQLGGVAAGVDKAAGETLDSTAGRAQEQARQRLLDIVAEETGMPSRGSITATRVSSARTSIDQILPRPVAIGFVPVRKDFPKPMIKSTLAVTSSVPLNQAVVEPEGVREAE